MFFQETKRKKNVTSTNILMNKKDESIPPHQWYHDDRTGFLWFFFTFLSTLFAIFLNFTLEFTITHTHTLWDNTLQ